MPRLSPRRPSRRLAFAQRRQQARQLATKPRLEERYAEALKKVVRGLHEDVERAIVPRLSEVARADAISPFSGDIDGILVKHIQEAPKVVSPLFARHAQDVADENEKALRVVGITPSNLRLGPVLAVKRDENIQLVEKAMRSYAADVRDVFTDPKTFGMRVEDIQQRLVDRGNVSESRAALIARDQTLKLNGAITKTRQENAGISRYVWSTSLDERVREEHRVLEGQTFDWNSAPPVGHPGEDFQCRCVAVPVIEGLDDITDFPQIPDPVDTPIETPEPIPEKPTELVAGTHFGEIESEASKATTQELLKSISDPGTLDFLERVPLKKLQLPKQSQGAVLQADGTVKLVDVNGFYRPSTGELSISSKRQDFTFGLPFKPGESWSISSTMKTDRDASKATLRHELGHHVHMANGDPIVDRIVRDAFARASAADVFITKYASTQPVEYFAESWAAYFFKRGELQKHDPNGYAMVEAVMKARGM